ncbi:mechanosensitive ion channel [Pseudomaricurvus alkylphenolicus]|jgi:small conductance mechanosensitive channel|uniref:mechanosensitive ion channel family protein n=1 Tax=Pseudomaricurvus alkylphenolicus TaxID=1306991 RepID=UPI00142462EC|nr:mechanosensitive ion channel domain-containing protein [Pseudomaricurvus alkylphenolicus]NIB39202.1 mechanosensitive ion channel [Pseudomaricurvus alkylphenolicus]
MNSLEQQYFQLKDLIAVYGTQVLVALVVLIIGLKLIKKVTPLISGSLLKHTPDETLAQFIGGAIDVLLKVLLIITVASMVGIETTSFVAVLGAASLAVGLALQGSLSNFAGGVMILIFRPIKVGDYVEAQGLEGIVKDIGIFVTTLETFDKRTLILPNGPLANGSIINHTRSEIRAVEVAIGVSYSDDLGNAKVAMEKVLADDPRILDDQDNVVAVVDLGSSSVDFLVRGFVKTEDYWSFFFDARPALKAAVEAAGCTIPFPQRDVHMIAVDAD